MPSGKLGASEIVEKTSGADKPDFHILPIDCKMVLCYNIYYILYVGEAYPFFRQQFTKNFIFLQERG